MCKILMYAASPAAVTILCGFLLTDSPRALRRGAAAVQVDSDDIGGIVTSAKGPEAGIWVIAETNDLPTKFNKIVVTDDQGRYVVPDLPKATYDVWVRGYGLVDSAKVKATPGKQLDLKAVVAPNAHAAAEYYPGNYWYAMLNVPAKSEFPGTGLEGNGIPESIKTQAEYLDRLKTSGCQVCHQLGNKATREIPASLGKFPSGVAAWERRLEAGQAGIGMAALLSTFGRERAFKMYADWTDRIAAGELPSQVPPRPQGIERNVVITQWDFGDPKTYVHDGISGDRWIPTINANGAFYGAEEDSSDHVSVLDPVQHAAYQLTLPLRDPNSPFRHPQMSKMASPYWGDEIIWKSKTSPHSSIFDSKGRLWTASVIRGRDNPAWCKAGSSHPSAKNFPLDQSGRQLTVYDLKAKKFTTVDTCFGTHRLQRSKDGVLYFSSAGTGRDVIGWFDTKIFDATGDEQKAQGWAPLILDSNGNGKVDPWVEPERAAEYGEASSLASPRDSSKDKRLSVVPYATVWNPVDGAVYLPVNSFPGYILRVTLGSNPPYTTLTEAFQPPFQNPKAPMEGTVPRGIDVGSDGVIWTNLSGSSHIASFDRRKCKGRLNGPKATGQHCPEGWKLYPLPGPQFKGVTDSGSADATYFNWVDQHDTLGLGKNTPLAIGNGSDSVHGVVSGKVVTLRVPYPLSFYSKGMDGRIDDPKTGWKGKALWTSSGTRAPWHTEGGRGSKPKVVKMQVRPDPLAH